MNKKKKLYIVLMLVLALITIITTIIILSPPPKLNVTSDDFIITVKTDNYGTTSDTQFKIPTYPGEIYNYNVDCDNDGIDEATGVRGDYTCNYSRPGTYTIIIKDNTGSGDGFPRIYFRNAGDSLKLVGINQWGTMHWSSMASAFEGCVNLNDTGTGSFGVAIDTPDLSGVTDMSYMFAGAVLFNQSINSWDTSNIKDMNHLFSGGFFTLKGVFIGTIDANDYSSFGSAPPVKYSIFNQPLNNWDTSNVKDMSFMFEGTEKFNQPLNNWDTKKVENMRGMFFEARSFDQNINSWDTHNVKNMSGMFEHAKKFNQPLDKWDTSNVTDMSYMFSGAYSFNQPLNSWNTSNVTNMKAMFSDFWIIWDLPFNQPLDKWDTSKVRDMSYMFYASYFDQDISNWNISSIEKWTDEKWTKDDKKAGGLNYMFNFVEMSVENYDAILNAWNKQLIKNNLNFDGGKSKYCAVEAHNNLTSPTGHNWKIIDGGLSPNCHNKE